MRLLVGSCCVQQRCFVGVVTSVKGDFSESMNVNVRVATAEVKKYPEVFSETLTCCSVWNNELRRPLMTVVKHRWNSHCSQNIVCMCACPFICVRMRWCSSATNKFKLYYLTPAVTHDRMVQALRGLTMSKHPAGVSYMESLPFSFPPCCMSFNFLLTARAVHVEDLYSIGSAHFLGIFLRR